MTKPIRLTTFILPVFKFLKTIPKAKVVTYKMLAQRFGIPNPRHVSWILRQNTDPDKIPCYKVVRANGQLAKGYKFGGQNQQKSRLVKEGIKFNKIGKTIPQRFYL